MSCDVGQATEGLENELWRRWSDSKVGEWADDWDGQDKQHVRISACTVLVGKPEGQRPLGRPSRRWEDNIKMDLREAGCDPGERIDLAEEGPMASLCKGGNEPPGSLKAN